ncbi:MAG: hypothetical protein EOM72_02475 [Opitutae bacterium]|nr:hypothetical protein [Opitutae bacterium]
MKKQIGWAAAGLAAWATAAGAFPTAIHQQGRLLDGTNLYNGAATIAYRLYDVSEAGAALAGATNDVTVVDGLYAADLDLTPAEWAAVLTNAELYLETDVNGTPLAPRERLGAVPYAQLAAGVTNGAIGELQLADGAATADKIGLGAVTVGKLGAGAVTAAKIGPGAVTGDKLGGDSVNSDKIADGSITTADVAANAFWQTDGNTGVGGGKFIGTTDGTSFEIRCLNESVFRADNYFLVAGTTIQIGRSNLVVFSPGAVLAGGFQNSIEDMSYNATLSGGTRNVIEHQAQSSVLAGGYGNRIGTNAFAATVSGGFDNTIGPGAEKAVVAGGLANSVSAINAAIGGGASNEVSGARSVVAGGAYNRVLAADAAIGGGTGNVATNTALQSVIGGGAGNLAAGAWSVVAGGQNNQAAGAAAVGGGDGNRAMDYACTVGGGAGNVAVGGAWATVGGGNFNQATGANATVAGGVLNVAQEKGFVGGGGNNRMGVAGRYGVIAGGASNVLFAPFGFIGGGGGNVVSNGANQSVVGGGGNNAIGEDSAQGVIAGGMNNYIFTNSPYGAIGGGMSNMLIGTGSAIGGGINNSSLGDSTTIAGGLRNGVWGSEATIGGGGGNFAMGGATVAGGESNSAGGAYSMIPGGFSNSTIGAYSFAAGQQAYAMYKGSFVWADSTDEKFESTTNDQFSVRAAGGVRLVGSTNLGSLTVSPLHNPGNQDAQIYLTETEAGSYGTILRHDGGANEFQIFGKNGTNIYGPNLVVTRDTGRVGVGRTPTANALEVEGNASKTAAGDWLAHSDARIKTDVRTIEGALETLAKLRPVAFRYTAEHRAKHPSIEDRDYNNFIAQEYREVFPDAVKEDGEGLLMLDPYDTQPYLVRAAQELAAAVAELRQENAELKRRLDALEAAQP